MKKVYAFLVGLAFSIGSFGGNVVAADLSFRCVAGLQYEFMITSITLGQPLPTDYIRIDFGDASPQAVGQAATTTQLADTSYYRNEWVFTHNYITSGPYDVLVKFMNRVPGILNIPNSTNVPGALKGHIFVDPIFGSNSSPVLFDELQKTAILSQNNSWNVMSLDSNGDSLSHFVIACMDTLGNPLPGYTIMPITIDPLTGDYEWNSPSQPGRFNVVIKTEEWFRMPNGSSILIGYVTREIQINVVQATGMVEPAVPLFSLYPNPVIFGEPITLHSVAFLGSPHAQLVNGLGQVIWEWKGGQGNTFSTLLPMLPDGIYLYRLGNEKEWVHSELLVIRKP